ncbi:hypothetical protein [Humisphaera borealis]|uniref:DUF4114 domain-containing protein n=1 Tax=Humisphaera borealis TaxID=2807512 RepID=A0A7M2WPY8_9BACT|nr:hypothetical protein [Humisphaera borealis]QOV87324.1 hypothetical protein IPV69_13590 [Humisphaera borealis]
MFSFLKSFASIRTLGLGAVALLAASNAHAGITIVAPTPHASEATTEQILSHQYGGSFTALGNGFTNGSVTATRIDDLNDVAWKGDLMTLNAIASFSRSQQSVGLLLGKSGGGYEHLFAVNQFGYLPAASTTVDTSGDFFRFVLDNGGTNLRSSSLTTENPFGDQLVTYQIDGLGKGPSRYLLFWEDAPIGNSDQDYNDLIVEASFAGNGGPTAVPLPPAVWGGLIVLGGMAGAMYHKKRKQLQTA